MTTRHQCLKTAGFSLLIAISALIVGPAVGEDVEVMEFEDELSDNDFICHWSLWTDSACVVKDGGKRCRADLSRKCLCLKFAEKPMHGVANYETRTCSFGTYQNKEDKPNGRCDSNCQLLDAFFRRLEGLDGAWCPWSGWRQDTCRMGSEGLLEGYQHGFRQCLCPPPWQEGSICHGSDSRSGNCRDSLSHVSSAFLDAWLTFFANASVGLALPAVLIAWFCCLAAPLRQGVQFGRLQSAAVAAELRTLHNDQRRLDGDPRRHRRGRTDRARMKKKGS